MCELVAILAPLGFIMGSLAITGVAHSFAREIVWLAGDNLVFLLMLGAVASGILGMGMPITACYIILAIILAPAIVQIGILPLAAHLYVLYWGLISYITPPVAVAAFIGAGIAGSPPMKTGFTAMRLGAILYFIPFFFVLDPSLILAGTASQFAIAFSTCVLGAIFIGSGLEGYLLRVGNVPMVARPFIVISGVLLGLPWWQTDTVGICLAALTVGGIILWSRRPSKTEIYEKDK